MEVAGGVAIVGCMGLSYAIMNAKRLTSMNKLLLLTFAACVVSSLSAQPGITFSLSNPKGTPPTGTGWTAGRGPGRVLTVKKSDPRAVEMFSFEVVDASGNVKCTYYRIDENRIAPVIDGDVTEWRTQPFLGKTGRYSAI